MTQLECFSATAAHEPHEGFLFYAAFSPAVENKIREKYGLGQTASLRDFFGMFNPVFTGAGSVEKAPERELLDYYRGIEIPDGAVFDRLGVLEIPGSMHHFRRKISPLRNAGKIEDLESFPWPRARPDRKQMSEDVRAARRAGTAAFASVGHMYEDAWQIRGYEEFLVDMRLRPEWCEFILDRLTERNIAIAETAAAAGADCLHTGDDVANQNSLMFGIGDWRRFIKARWEKVYSAAKAVKPDIQIWYHSDGNIFSIIPELIDIGVTILNPVQPECVEPGQVKSRYGDKIVLDGTVGTQSTMPFASAPEVRRVVRKRAQSLGKDGALILSPTHMLEPEVPLENIEAFVDEVKKFGIIG